MRTAIVYFMLLLATATWGQSMVVSGTVEDQTTGKPVGGANVQAAGLSVVTNADGFFTLKSQHQELTAVTVSHIGYESRRVAVTGQPLTISLRPTAVLLSEVVVMADNARELVRKAIGNIAENYSREAENYRCFYRETAMKRQHFITVAEGVVDMYKSGYTQRLVRDRVAIRKGRRLLSAKASDTLGVKVLGGPVTPVMLDMVKNPDLLLNDEELSHYELKMETPTTIGDRRQYVVSLTPHVVMPYALYYGRLYIDQQTLAFTRVELSLDMSDRHKATSMMLVRKPLRVRFRPKELSLLIDYRQGSDGLTRMSYVRTTFRFNCDWRRRLFATPFTATCEMAVTSTTGKDVQKISGRESFDQRDAFFDRVDFFRDPAFWQDYNIIEPTETLDRAIDKLMKRYE